MLRNLSVGLLNPSVGRIQVCSSRNVWNSLRHKYLKKSPIIRVDPDGSYHVEGVSNKQTPIPVLWREPVKSETHYSFIFNPYLFGQARSSYLSHFESDLALLF